MARQKIYIVQTINLYKDDNGHFITLGNCYYAPYLYTSQKKAIDFIKRLINEWIKTGYRIAYEPQNPQERCKAFTVSHWSLTDAYEERKMIISLDCQYPM